MVGIMFASLRAYLHHLLPDRVKGALSWLGSAMWWIADKQFGDAVFKRVLAMLGPSLDAEWLRLMWAYGPPGLLFLLGLYFFRRRESVRAPASSLPSNAVPNPSNATLAPPRLTTSATAASEPSWDRLYEIVDPGSAVRLRFLPDTESQKENTILLVVLGYKVMRETNRVDIQTAHAETERVMLEAPNSSIPRVLAPLYLMSVSLKSRMDLGQRLISQGYLERVGLSAGGYYELTAGGIEKAESIASDLIRRA